LLTTRFPFHVCVQLELLNQEPVIRKLNDAVNVMVQRSKKTSASLREKQQEMMNTYMTAQVIARDKLHEIHGRLKEVGYLLRLV